MQRKQLWRLFCSVVILAAMCLAALVLAGSHWRSPLYWILVLGFLGSAFWFGSELVKLRKGTIRYVAKMNSLIDRTMDNAPEHMPVPLVILNARHEVLWYNESFADCISGGADLFGQPLQSTIPLRPDAVEDGETVELDLYDRHYLVSRTDYERKSGHAELFCFQDITNYANLRRTYMDSRPCVLMIVIDNFEDLFSGTRQSERALVLASLETLFDKLLEGTNSVFCHLDDDRFMIITEVRYCIEMERAHFPLLDEARKILVKGRTSLTLSIGVGRSGTNIAQNEHYAQQSLDMALGRGGDQAAIKTESGFTFYGGVSKGIEHRNKAKNRAVARELHKLMMRCSHVYIMGHRASDLDAVGAAVGVAFIAEQTGIPYNIVIRTQTTLASLLTDRIEQEMPGCMISPDTARERISDTDLLVIVDTFSKDIVEDAELYQLARHVVVIDHHRQMVNYLDNTTLKLHDPYASSAAELVTGMIQFLDFRDQMPQFCAEALLAGIMLDTKNFIMQTGVHTFEVAAFLRERGADPIAVKTLFAESLDAYRHRSKLVSEAELHGRFAIAMEEEELPDIRIIASQAADELLGVEGVAASFVVYPSGGQACVSARSLGKMNVQIIMEQLGGGGHQIMAATQRRDVTVQQLRSMLIEVLYETEAKLQAAQQTAAEQNAEPQKG
ncbi:MAG: DHH family phosphoesterase [Oscillospiraceae bacterium]|nr:DHH family phosphoesterase [Oscillospiraceae bacterium]